MLRLAEFRQIFLLFILIEFEDNILNLFLFVLVFFKFFDCFEAGGVDSQLPLGYSIMHTHPNQFIIPKLIK